MSTRHIPVLLDELLHWLRPAKGNVVVDLTLGGGGYSAAFLERGAKVIAFDRDPGAVVRGRERFAGYGGAFVAHQSDFASFGRCLDEEGMSVVDGICMDLGLSSDQLDDPMRGFGFRHDGPLDLRFDPQQGESAGELIARSSARELQRILQEFGEVRRARTIAEALKSHEGSLGSAELREIVRALTPRSQKPEPELARVFQALRIAVNDELGQLDATLVEIPVRLRPGGRFVCVAYHSLEDRRVKQMLRRESGEEGGSRHLPEPRAAQARLRTLTRRAVVASEAEIRRNPRARSARLRAGERLS